MSLEYPAFSKEHYEDPRVVAAMEEIMNKRDIRPEIMVHSNVNNTFKKWVKEDKIDLFYTPENGNPFEVADEMHVKASLGPNLGGKFWFNNLALGKYFKKKFKGMEKYPIPAEKVDETFGMIETEKPPEDIVAYLTS